MSKDMIQPDGYGEILDRLKAQVRAAQLRAHRVVNTRAAQPVLDDRSDDC
jgi:hypothetical protein